MLTFLTIAGLTLWLLSVLVVGAVMYRVGRKDRAEANPATDTTVARIERGEVTAVAVVSMPRPDPAWDAWPGVGRELATVRLRVGDLGPVEQVPAPWFEPVAA